MTKVYKLGEARRYDVIDKECLARACFDPGQFPLFEGEAHQVTLSCCLTNARDGCPACKPDTKELRAQRKEAGWRLSL